MEFITTNGWLIAFLLWGMPLGLYRSRFRKAVYQTDAWTINIKPVFGRELKGLFVNLYPEDESYLKLRNFYRFYLGIYLLLMTAYYTLG